MRKVFNRVAGLIGVSSKCKTKSFSVVFGLFLLSIVAALCFSSLSIASDITAGNVVGLTNQSRAEAGKKNLAENEKLSLAAQAKVEDMLANNYFSHTSPAGRTPWKWIEGENYDYSYAGENLAMDFHSAEAMEKAWMESPTHRANILNDKYIDMGVAVKEGNINGHSTMLAVVMFGSGDKKLSSADEKTEIKSLPVLPPAGKRETAVFQQPMVTSPQYGESVSAGEIKISGRAAPGETVWIFDNQNFAGLAVADPEGWFSLVEKDLPEGKHTLTLEGKISSGTAREFFVDKTVPDVDFHLWADTDNPQRLFLEASANKDNCLLQFDGEARRVSGGAKTFFAVDFRKSTFILRVRDIAGNKNFKQVNLANYYAPERQSNISGRLAAFLSPPKNIYAADSGRKTMLDNLNLPAHKFLAAR